MSANGEEKGLSILADAAAYVDYDTNDCCWDNEAFLNEAVEMCDLASSPKKLVSQEPVCHDAASLFAKSNSFGEAIASTFVEDKPEFPSPEKFAQMIYRNEGGANWTESEFQSNANASENRTAYEDCKYKTFDNFLSILEEHGGEHCHKLASETVDLGFGRIPRLIHYLKSERRKDICPKILDEALKIYVTRFKMKDGTNYKPSSLHTLLKHIFAVLRLKYDLEIGINDFQATGSFRGVVSEMWTANQEVDPTFAVKKGMSDINLRDLVIINDKILDGTLVPYEKPLHLKVVVIFILIRLFGFRRSDVAIITRNYVEFIEYKFGPDIGKRYCLITILFSKSNRLKLSTTGVPSWYGQVKVRDNEGEKGYFNPFRIMEFYVSKLRKNFTGDERFLKSELKRKNIDLEDVWFGRQNVGLNYITNVYRTIGDVIKDESFNNITSHGGRACLITSSIFNNVTPSAIISQTRHAQISSIGPYARNTLEGEAKMQDSLLHYYDKVESSPDGALEVIVPSPDLAKPSGSAVLPVSAITSSNIACVPSCKSHESGLIDPTNEMILSVNNNLSEENKNLRLLLLQERQNRQQLMQQPLMQNPHSMPFHPTAQDELYIQRKLFSSPNPASNHYPYDQYPQEYNYNSRGREVRERRTWYHNCSFM